MRSRFTFPLFLGILAISLGQFLCVFFLGVSCQLEERDSGLSKSQLLLQCRPELFDVLEGLCVTGSALVILPCLEASRTQDILYFSLTLQERQIPSLFSLDEGKISHNVSMMENTQSLISSDTLRSLPLCDGFSSSNSNRRSEDLQLLSHKASHYPSRERVCCKVHEGILLCGNYSPTNRISYRRSVSYVCQTLARATRAILVGCHSKKGH